MDIYHKTDQDLEEIYKNGEKEENLKKYLDNREQMKTP
eukprot:CAMPEP_0176377578 /NCGR_PEP_ID=MMETSP0126-20121128/28994_1 /TAXON_ID=141414 ORGANISM="Strombidinopsis acuminatum, Strain SPMC142" /NCGR_SAMPLE_ID=MMETSP0126 /ASSEMBLY_ACC=CAM_ASM_000229 /LENGTH=37 /DNA_ID= /DNA_START= /DNA_END= /DNA_ORIENTATION=